MPNSDQILDFKVAGIVDKYRVVINRGSNDGIEIGDRFLILSIGEELFDPDTSESLGCVEVIKGKGEVTHVQEKMATLQTTDTHEIKTRPSGLSAAALFQVQGTVVEKEPKAFIDPEVGDIARPI
jgi:hypothetical protein